MRQRNLITALFVGAIMMFASCTKEGPEGPAGTNGTNGTATCMECHDADQTIGKMVNQWAQSGHAAGTALARSSSPSCAGCHSQQGFMQTDGNNPLTEADWEAVDNPLVINCYACHPIHETSTYADVQNLHFSDQPNWAVTSGKTVDMDLGKGNTCAHCHQSRKRDPVVDMTDLTKTYTGISTHYGPHYSSQANTMGAFGAYEIPGAMSYPVGNSHKNATDGCVSCHMGFTANGAGGHVMGVHEDNLVESCVQCHSSGADAPGKYATYYARVFRTVNDDDTKDSTSLYTLLGDALVDEGVYTKDFSQNDDGDWEVHYDIVSGLTIDGTLTAALFNHRFLYQDHSHGMHNPVWSEALLQNSLDAVLALK